MPEKAEKTNQTEPRRTAGTQQPPRVRKPARKGQRRHMYGIKRRWMTNSLSITILILVGVIMIVGFSTANYYYSGLRSNLVNRAQTTARFANKYMGSTHEDFYSNTERITDDFEDKDKVELQIIDEYGRVMFSSSGLTAGMLPSTSDVAESMQGTDFSLFQGLDELTGERVLSVSVPLYIADGTVGGAVRYVSSLSKADKAVARVVLMTVAAAALVLLLVLISSSYFIRSIVNPVVKLNALARKIAAGRYGERIEKEFDDEIGELCDTINYMSAEISRAEKVKNDFISSVSHELRTPLTAIGGWTETLMAGAVSDVSEIETGLRIIQSETMRLSQMVEELLDFGRLESGRMKLQMEHFDLCGELSDAVFIYRESLKREGIAVSYDEPDEPVVVTGDRHRLKQVFLNIIDNAAKYGRDGGKIALFVRQEGGNAIVEVRDYGQGIPAEELPFVKEKFYKGSSKQRGTGIGLAVCDEIVRMHGGSLVVKSRVGDGTLVIITIPVSAGDTAEEEEKAE